MIKLKSILGFAILVIIYLGCCPDPPNPDCRLPTADCVTDFAILKVDGSFVEDGVVNELLCREDPCQINVMGTSMGLQQSFYLHVYVRGVGSGTWYRSRISSELDIQSGEWTRVVQLGWQGDPPQGKVFTVVGIVSAENLNKDEHQVVSELDEDLPSHLKTPFVTISVAD